MLQNFSDFFCLLSPPVCALTSSKYAAALGGFLLLLLLLSGLESSEALVQWWGVRGGGNEGLGSRVRAFDFQEGWVLVQNSNDDPIHVLLESHAEVLLLPELLQQL